MRPLFGNPAVLAVEDPWLCVAGLPQVCDLQKRYVVERDCLSKHTVDQLKENVNKNFHINFLFLRLL